MRMYVRKNDMLKRIVAMAATGVPKHYLSSYSISFFYAARLLCGSAMP